MSIYSFDRRFRGLERAYRHSPMEETLLPYNVARGRAGMEILDTCPECGNIDEETHHYYDERRERGLGCEECDVYSCGACGLAFGESYYNDVVVECERCGITMCESCQLHGGVDDFGDVFCEHCLPQDPNQPDSRGRWPGWS